MWYSVCQSALMPFRNFEKMFITANIQSPVWLLQDCTEFSRQIQFGHDDAFVFSGFTTNAFPSSFEQIKVPVGPRSAYC